MSVYNKSGTIISSAYNVGGSLLPQAYDIDGTPILSGIPLKVMQYNCGQWYVGDHDNVPADKDEEYYALQNGMIQQNNPDILLIEEYTAQFSKAGRTALSMLQSDYPYYHEQTNGTTTTVVQRAIFSKYPLSNYQTHIFTSHSNYYFDSCTITVANIPITVVALHFHWNNRTYRTQEAAALLEFAESNQYVIIGGDFNTVDCSDTSGADYIAEIKPFVDAEYNVANCGEFGFLGTYTGNSSAPYTMSVLDNIITSSNIDIDSVTVDETKLTDLIGEKVDHLPIIAELTINTGGTT